MNGSGKSMAGPTSREVYEWNVAQFGVGIIQNYVLCVVEETSELHDVIAQRESGELAGFSRFQAMLGSEIGDVWIALHALAAYEDFELAEEVARVSEPWPDGDGGHQLYFAELGPRELADRAVRCAGQLTRAVLKRDQAIRETPEFWGRHIRDQAGLLAYAAAGLAPWFGLAASDAVASRWADVSTRDARGHRPPEESRSPGGLGYAPEQIEKIKAAGVRVQGNSGPPVVTTAGTAADPTPDRTPDLSPEQAMEEAARGGVPRCTVAGCSNRIPSDVRADAPGLPESLRCAHCRAGDARVGDAVMVNTAVEVTHCTRWWPGRVVQFGPAAAVHGLAALGEGDVRVVLTPQTWGDGAARPLPGGGVVVVPWADRWRSLAVDDSASAGPAPAAVQQWGPGAEQDGQALNPHGLRVH